MTYNEWLASVPPELTNDPLWRMEVYRLAVFASDLAWHDVSKLAEDKRTVSLSDQLYRAIGSVSANIAEGYSRRSGKDQARFYEYALGSARSPRLVLSGASCPLRNCYHAPHQALDPDHSFATHHYPRRARLQAERRASVLRCGPDRPARQHTHAVDTQHATRNYTKHAI